MLLSETRVETLRSGASVCNPRAGPLRTDFAKDAEKTPPSTQARAASTALGVPGPQRKLRVLVGLISAIRAQARPGLMNLPHCIQLL